MEWIIPLALSFLMMKESERLNGTANIKSNLCKFSQYSGQSDNVQSLSKHKTMGGQNRKNRPRNDPA